MNRKPTISEQRCFPAHGVILGRQLFRSARKCTGILLAVALAGFSAATAWAADVPSGTVSGSGTGPSYIYTLSFSDGASATSPIGSVWYGWVYPVYNYLPGVPSSASAPSGWVATITNNSIEFIATSSSSYIQPGHSLSGFSYTASYTPATLQSDTAAAYSYAYTAGIESEIPGAFFSVTTVPEPSAAALFAMSALGLGLARWRRLLVKA